MRVQGGPGDIRDRDLERIGQTRGLPLQRSGVSGESAGDF